MGRFCTGKALKVGTKMHPPTPEVPREVRPPRPLPLEPVAYVLASEGLFDDVPLSGYGFRHLPVDHDPDLIRNLRILGCRVHQLSDSCPHAGRTPARLESRV